MIQGTYDIDPNISENELFQVCRFYLANNIKAKQKKHFLQFIADIMHVLYQQYHQDCSYMQFNNHLMHQLASRLHLTGLTRYEKLAELNPTHRLHSIANYLVQQLLQAAMADDKHMRKAIKSILVVGVDLIKECQRLYHVDSVVVEQASTVLLELVQSSTTRVSTQAIRHILIMIDQVPVNQYMEEILLLKQCLHRLGSAQQQPTLWLSKSQIGKPVKE